MKACCADCDGHEDRTIRFIPSVHCRCFWLDIRDYVIPWTMRMISRIVWINSRDILCRRSFGNIPCCQLGAMVTGSVPGLFWTGMALFFDGIPGIQFASGKALKMLNDFSTYDAIYSLGAMDPVSVCGFGVGGFCIGRSET